MSEQPAFGGNGTDCSDGLDNEGDGLIDYPADTDCEGASGASEGLPPPDGGLADGSPDGSDTQSEGGAQAAPGTSGDSSSGCACMTRGAGAGGGAWWLAAWAIALGAHARRARRRG